VFNWILSPTIFFPIFHIQLGIVLAEFIIYSTMIEFTFTLKFA